LFQQVSKDIVPFQQDFPIEECDVKNDPIGHPESDKTIRLRLPVLLGIRLRRKTFDSATLVATSNKIVVHSKKSCFNKSFKKIVPFHELGFQT